MADQTAYINEIQLKYDQLLHKHNEEKQKINDFMSNSLSISAKTILQLTTEIDELKRKSKESTTAGITDGVQPSV